MAGLMLMSHTTKTKPNWGFIDGNHMFLFKDTFKAQRNLYYGTWTRIRFYEPVLLSR